MSGLCGMVTFRGSPIEHVYLEKLASAAPHRGTATTWAHEDAGLAVLGAGADGALRSDSGLVAAVHARFDNGAAVAAEVERGGRGVPPDVRPADLLIAAYQSWGTDCVRRFVGDFALVIWDSRRRQLLAWRDPMGMRPLYYRHNGSGVAFASEVAQLLALPDQSVRIRERAVLNYLAGRFGELDSTFYQGIHSVPPGCVLIADSTGTRVRRFWDVDPAYVLPDLGEDVFAEMFREVFTEAVRCRVAGRQLGILLSGGMDSGSIASVAGTRPAPGTRLHAYSFAFEELSECDERRVSRILVEAFGLPSTEIPADARWPLSRYPEHGPHRDEPFIGVFQPLLDEALARAAADGMEAMISGDRGDLVVGDEVYDELGLARAGHLGSVLGALRARSGATGRSMPRVALDRLGRPLLVSRWPGDRLAWLRRWLQARLIRATPSPPPWLATPLPDPHRAEEMSDWRAAPLLRGAARQRRHELIFAPMHHRGVLWSERTNARHGVGFVDPWSDRRLAELILAMPQYRVQAWDQPKSLLRAAMDGVMPDAALRRATKVDPGPFYELALRDKARATIDHLLTDSRAAAAGWVDGPRLRNAYEGFLAGEALRPEFWWALSLEMWLRAHFD